MANKNTTSLPDQKFNSFLEVAPDAIVVVDRDGKIVMINQLTEKLFKYNREELIGQKVEILVPERSRHTHVQQRTGYSLEPRTRPMGEGRELSGRRKDGSEFPVEISLSPMQTDQDQWVISIIRDITPRKKLEAKFRGLLESAPDGILVVDTQGTIVIANGQAEKLFGYSKNELIGQEIEILVPHQFKKAHVSYRTDYITHPITRPMGAGRLLTGLKKDGTQLPIEISLSPLETEHGTLITSIIRDITERRRDEEQMKIALREKEALLKEIHHRVKNNLQITSSLLRLQSDYIQDEKAKYLFTESQNRIRSMALVHEKLYRSSDLSRINFYEYTDSLTQLLFRSFGVNTHLIKFHIEGSPVLLSIENAVPCGLIVNELVSNCLKHAFPNNRSGDIRITIDRAPPNSIIILVRDNGIGLPQDFKLTEMDSLGLQLVRTLANQLSAHIEVKSETGTLFQILIPENRTLEK